MYHPPVTPVKVKRLEYLLEHYDPCLKSFLTDGFSQGFRIGFLGERRAIDCINLKSALDQPDILKNKLDKEREAGRIAGPFNKPPFKQLHCSPLGVVPKKNPGEFRIIHHLSYPNGSSINDFIPEHQSSVKYASISDAITLIKQAGEGSFMAKTDIKSAFRIIPVHPDDQELLGMKIDNSYFFDRCLPMGCSSSCAIFEAFSTALEWLSVNNLGASGVVHILDDFLFIADKEDKCQADLDNFLRLCAFVGVPIAGEKTESPNTVLQFAGITLDTKLMEARLPEDKLHKCRTLLHTYLKRRKVTLKELQSLLGLLNFTCSVIVPGRAFLRRMIDLTKGVRRPYHRIKLNTEAKLDMKVWLGFLTDFNGRAFFRDDIWHTDIPIALFTDAAGSKGYGAVLANKWFFGAWPASWKVLNITILELFPIVVALRVWNTLLKNRNVLFYTDNAALVYIINQQTSKNRGVMVLIRDLVLTSLKYNIIFQAKHIPGINNTRADLISRFQVSQFKQITPEAEETPTIIPESLKPESWSIPSKNSLARP